MVRSPDSRRGARRGGDRHHQGLTAGHAGFSTIHGGSCLHGLTRTLQLTRLHGEPTVSPEMISDTIDDVVLTKRRPNGPRYVADIQRVLGWRDNRYDLEPITAEHVKNA